MGKGVKFFKFFLAKQVRNGLIMPYTLCSYGLILKGVTQMKRTRNYTEIFRHGLTLIYTVLFIFLCPAASSAEIFLAADVNMPEPNEEVTVRVESDTPLFCMEAAIYVIGDANIFDGMNSSEAPSYGGILAGIALLLFMMPTAGPISAG